MQIKRLLWAVLLALTAPVASFAGVAYVPSRPCNCNAAWMPAYPSWNPGCQQNWVKAQENAENSEPYNFQKQQGQEKQQKKRSINQDYDYYIAANITKNMWSWDNEYESNYTGVDLLFNNDHYSFESVWGGSVAVGTVFESGLRGDVELGVSKKFKDIDDFAGFTMHVPYVMANVYKDFESGFYLGAGLGVARPTVTIQGDLFDNIETEKNSISPKIGVSVGFATRVADNFFIDLRYRFSGLKGTDISSKFWWDQYNDGNYEQFYMQVKAGLIMENAVSAGIRFTF